MIAAVSRRLARRVRPLAADARGASLIEFALFLPILAMMVMGISDVAMGYARKLELEAGAYRALEKVAVGSVQTDYEYLKNDVAAEAEVTAADVEIDLWLECDRTRQTDFTGTCGAGQELARYIEVAVDTTYETQFDYGPLARSMGGDNGFVPVSATAALRLQ